MSALRILIVLFALIAVFLACSLKVIFGSKMRPRIFDCWNDGVVYGQV